MTTSFSAPFILNAPYDWPAHHWELDGAGQPTTTGAGNLFTVFGEPDLRVHDKGGGTVSVGLAGVDTNKGSRIESKGADEIAVWSVDTDYDYEGFFVRHAYSQVRPTPTRRSRPRLRRRSAPRRGPG